MPGSCIGVGPANQMSLEEAQSEAKICRPVSRLTPDKMCGKALRYYSAVEVLLEANQRREAWDIMSRGLNLGDPEEAPTRIIPHLAPVELKTLKFLLAAEAENLWTAGASLLGHAYLNHGILSMGQLCPEDARISLSKARDVFEDIGENEKAAAASRQLSQNCIGQLALAGWFREQPEMTAKILLEAEEHAAHAGRLSVPRTPEGGESRYVFRAAGAVLAHALHLTARHSAQVDKELTLRDLHDAGLCFAEAEGSYLNSFDPSYVGRENSIEMRTEERMMALMPGAQYNLYLLDRAAMLPEEREACLQQARIRAEHNLNAARRIWPPRAGSVEPASFDEALAMSMRGLTAAACGFDSVEGNDFSLGLSGLRNFGRLDILKTFKLEERYAVYKGQMLNCGFKD